MQRSHHEARQALLIQERLGMPPAISWFGDLGIFRFLFAAEGLPEFDDFHADTLQKLVDYDAKHRTDLVETLQAYFNANASPKDAAERLGVHRNTVLYRLERIANVTGYDLGDAETRLRLQLALAMHTIKRSRTDTEGVRAASRRGA
jgi:purine catabolism regulator